MLFMWKRRGFPIRLLRAFVLRSLALLAGYIGLGLLLIMFWLLIRGPWKSPSPIELCVGLWVLVFSVSASLAVAKNFFGSAAIHPGLPALLTTVTAWLSALLGLRTGPDMIYVLAGPVSVTVIASLELSRLRRRHGIALLIRASAPPQP
jgi:hypothetical protein